MGDINYVGGIFIFFLIFGIICILIKHSTEPTKSTSVAPPPTCPKCASENIITTKTTSYSYQSTRTVTRRIDHFNNDGEERGYSEYEETVPDEITSYTDYKKCNNCSHEWKT